MYDVLVKEHSLNVLAVPRYIAAAVLLSFVTICIVEIVKILLCVKPGNVQPEVGLEFVLGIDLEGGAQGDVVVEDGPGGAHVLFQAIAGLYKFPV